MSKFTPEEKYRIVTEGRKGPKGVKNTCKKYGISRETFYQWETRIKEAALFALEDKPPGPKMETENTNAADKQLEELRIENAVLRLKQEWIHFQLELHGTPEQQKLINQGKKKHYLATEKKWLLEKRIAYEELSLQKYLDIFGLSASAYHKWGKKETLEDRKPVPLSQPRTTPPEELTRALNTSLVYCRWGGQKLSAFLLQNEICYLSPATLNRIKKHAKEVLLEKGLKLPVSYEFISANDAWSLDFLEFKWGVHTLYILTVIDDYSRYLLNWTVTTKATVGLVQELLQETFKLYGAPGVVKSDNGPQFRNELALFLEKMQIEHYPSPYYRPEYNGKTERQNRELRFAVKRAAKTETPEECISIIGRSFYEYNYIRPHQALGGVTPYQRFSGFEQEIKARVKVFKEQELQRKKQLVKRTLWVPGMPDPQYIPQKLVLPNRPEENLKGLIVPVKSKKHRGKIIGYVRQSLHA